MTNRDRQITLETRMYRKKSFGKEKYCNHCWVCEYHENCIAQSVHRSAQRLCVKAENRMKGKPTDTKLSETLQGAEKRKRKYLFLQLGLKQEEIKNVT